eukprot:scaffold31699_cov25-Tisochrysis_lutea.AAC.1
MPPLPTLPKDFMCTLEDCWPEHLPPSPLLAYHRSLYKYCTPPLPFPLLPLSPLSPLLSGNQLTSLPVPFLKDSFPLVSHSAQALLSQSLG